MSKIYKNLQKVKEGGVSLSLIYQIMVRLKNGEKKDSSLFKELQEFISQKKNEEIYNKYDKRIKQLKNKSFETNTKSKDILNYHKKLVVFKPSKKSEKLWNKIIQKWKNRDSVDSSNW